MKRYALKEGVVEGLKKIGLDSAALLRIDRQFNVGEKSHVLIDSNIDGVKLNMWRCDVCEIVEIDEDEVGAVVVVKEVVKEVPKKRSFEEKLFFVVLLLAACCLGHCLGHWLSRLS